MPQSSSLTNTTSYRFWVSLHSSAINYLSKLGDGTTIKGKSNIKSAAGKLRTWEVQILSVKRDLLIRVMLCPDRCIKCTGKTTLSSDGYLSLDESDPSPFETSSIPPKALNSRVSCKIYLYHLNQTSQIEILYVLSNPLYLRTCGDSGGIFSTCLFGCVLLVQNSSRVYCRVFFTGKFFLAFVENHSISLFFCRCAW